MKKIKIIDLLNKIANKYDVPYCIQYEGKKYYYNDIYGDYLTVDEADEYLFKKLLEDKITSFFINSSVFILEDYDYTFKKNEIIDNITLIKKCYNMSLKINEINEKINKLNERISKDALDK